MAKTNYNKFHKSEEGRTFKSVDELYSTRGGNLDKRNKRTKENKKRFIEESMEDED